MISSFIKQLKQLLVKPFKVAAHLATVSHLYVRKNLASKSELEKEIAERKQIEEALRISEEKLSNFFCCSLDSITISRLIDRRYIEVNNSFLRVTGYNREEVIGRTSFELNIWAKSEESTRFERILQQHKAVSNLEACFLTKSGEAILGLVSAEIIDFDGSPCIMGVIRDITEHKRVEQALLCAQAAEAAKLVLEKEIIERQRVEEALRISEEKFFKAFRSSPDSLIISTLADGCYIEVNDVFLSLTGYSRDEIIGSCTDALNLWVDLQKRNMMQTILYQQGTVRNLECDFRMKTGEIRVGLLSAEIIQINSQQCLLSVIRDITERKQAEEQLRHNAFHDSLTDLPNRTLFMERLEHAFERAKGRAACSFAVLFLDLDRFKVINDSLGHAAGDQLLIEIANRLKEHLRAGDTVARLGGDEFTILLGDIQDISVATYIANRLIKGVMLPFDLDGHELCTSVSVGITFSSTAYSHAEEILRDADIAMYRAKSRGGARYAIFDSSMHAYAVARLQLETDLRRAIEHQELQLHYQPIVSLQSFSLVGFEALIRWQHPQRGLIPSMEFIPLAEETGLIDPIGNWVLYEACRQMRLWQIKFPCKHPLMISVNLSGRQFTRQDLVEQINKILQKTNLDAYSLALEITETVVMENTELAADMLLQLKSLGIQLGIDDFGTGYSSLSYLHRFPINTLKIDRSFVSRMSLDSESGEIVRTITKLAHDLGMNVVAEGVETVQHLRQLTELKCEYGQGYFFSKAVNSDLAEAFITKNHGHKSP